MAKGTQARYSIELDFTTGKAEQSVKAATDKIKERLNSIATEANKTKYFEGLIGDIHDVDAQLTQLKEKHGKDFESIYQGIGEGVRQEFESIFAYARSETEKFYAEINAKQAEFSGLQQIQKDYKKYSKSATQAMSGAYVTGFGKSMDATQVQNMYNSFDKLLAKKAEFEKVGNTSSKEYLENYVQILKTASGLIKADAEVANDDKDFGIDVEALYNMAEKAKSILNSLDISGFASKITDATNSVKANLQEQMKSFAEAMPDRIKNAFSGVGGNNQADQNKAIALSYDELSKKLNEYLKLQKMADEGIDFDSNGKNIQDQIADLEDYFDALGKTDEEIRKIQDITGNVAFNDLGIEDAIQQMSEFINIVNASEESINSLRNSIQEVFMSSSNIESDTRSGKLNGKESMNLFDINGNVSTVQGADYQVDTDTLVKQVVANLNKNIVMSLHNHANGDLTFSPSDISSFAKLYYGQGTKINGIIADGIIQTIDFNGVSQEIAIKIAQDYQEGIKNLFSSENIARFASLEDGEIVPTDLLKQIQTNNAAEYQEIVSQLQEATMITLRQAFESNGAEFTLQSFNVDSIGELSQYLSNIQQNGQAAIEPVEKLKNLVETLRPGTDLEQFTEIFDKFKSGAIDGTQALNQILDFKTVAADVSAATVSIEQAEAKLKEFLALTEEIRTKNFDYYGNAEDNVEVGKYTERLTTAKAALDELGDQGLLTAEQLNQVQEAFNRANSNLNLSTSHYSGYGDGYYDYSYYDEYKEQQKRADDLEAQNRDLQEQFNNAQKTSTEQNQNAQYSAEIAQLNQLKAKLTEVKQAVDLKTQAFEEEYVTVAAAVDAEVQSLQLLLNQLQEVLKQINLISEGFTKTNAEIAELHNIKDVDIKENITSETTADKAAETISQNYALDSTLTETNGILGQILTAIGNNESIKGLVEPLNAAVSELKNVASGIIEHQKAQRTDLADSSTRIANNYGQLSSITGNAVAGLGGEVQIENMKALADNIVRVRGAVQNADGVWKGFIIDIDEANNAVVRAVDEQSTFTRSLNESAQAAKNVGDEVKKQKSPNDNQFTKSLNDQISAFDKYRESLKNVSYISGDVTNKLDELGTSLRQITDTAGLDDWKNKFADIQKQISLTKNTFTAQQVGKVNQAKETLDASFKTLDFKRGDSNLTAEQQQLVIGYRQAEAALKAYRDSAQQGNQIELSTIQNVTDALYKQIEAYKQIHNIVNAGGGSKNAYGATAVLNAKAKYNSLSQQATSGEFANSQVIQQMLAGYTASYEKLIALQGKFKTGENLTNEQVLGFKQAQTECNNYAKELNKVIVASQKLASEGDSVGLLGGDFEDNIAGRQSALRDFIETAYGASAKIGEFKDNYNQLTFAVDNGNGTFTQMTATINAARSAIVATAGDTGKATSAFGRFFNELKGKFKTISTYLISSFSLQEIWQQIRRGVTYIREIDSALTELKKVTDETDATYEKFLQTASKTASIIGSTVADFTNATADFARLGYNIEEAAKLAEAASVYKNVGDGIDDVATASESIISTMKAFGIEAENAMGIVDRFNEVGNNFAISSTGIGEALQRSASALYEAGNTIDESVALITAANSVIQNPEQVGECLPT